MAKVQISIDDELLEKIDRYAKNNYMSRSGFLSMVSNQYLSTQEFAELAKSMNSAMKKVAENGVIDDDTMRQLESFEMMTAMLK